MVAYNFKKRFVAPIRAGSKCQTIRANGKREHPEYGTPLQLYCGQRTQHCFLIGRARCGKTQPVFLSLPKQALGGVSIGEFPKTRFLTTIEDLDAFARQDGFQHWGQMRLFWQVNHPWIETFQGTLIPWLDFEAAPIADDLMRLAL